MYLLNGDSSDEVEQTTFSELDKKERDIEELLRKNINMVCEGEESMLIVGQQVRDVKNKRSDLTAIDNNGNIVLIEIKRDKKDIENRKEAFEFQAIRYAASCATIEDTEELIQDIFAPYVEHHKKEFSAYENLTSTEIAHRVLDDFIQTNGIDDFNERQRIILVASEFDDQTLSAVAWLCSNNVDISCYQMTPYSLNGITLIDMRKVLPLEEYRRFFVDVSKQPKVLKQGKKSGVTRTNLPKINDLLDNHVIEPGAVLRAKNRDSEAVLQKDGQVKVSGTGRITSLQQWLKEVYGWSSVETYALTVDVASGKTLSEIRAAYLDRIAAINQ